MPGLPYRGLPAGMSGMIQMEGGQPTYIPERPSTGASPIQDNSARTQLESDYKRDRAAMAQEYMAPIQWNNRLAKLNLKYQIKIEELNKAQQEQQRKQELLFGQRARRQAGGIGGEEEARLRLKYKLPEEQFVFGKPSPKPYSGTQIASGQKFMKPMLETIEDPSIFAKNIASMKGALSKWYLGTPGMVYGLWAGRKKAAVKGKSLVDVYKDWQNQIGYHEIEAPIHKQQLDLAWDALMRSDPKYDSWFTERGNVKNEVKMLRSRGPGTRAIQKRVGGTPLGASIAGSIKGRAPAPVAQQKPITATNPTTGRKITSYDGGKTWQ